MKREHKLTLLLSGIWVASILYGEMFAFWIPSLFSSCSWPHLAPKNKAASPNDYVKVAVLTDPQLMDRTSLHLPPKSLALEIALFYSDLYMRRAFFSSIMPYKPDVILFLGDYFDGGPYLSDQEWQESLHRFRHIFGLNVDERYKDIQIYYIAGNHDIGYAGINSHALKCVNFIKEKGDVPYAVTVSIQAAIRRYEQEFGIRNYRFNVGKVEFIAVDSQTLDGHPQENLTTATWEFVKNVSNDIQLNPRVLLTHIPLYRLDNTFCGPHRNSKVIDQRIVRSSQNQEIVYQNYVTEESSSLLLDLIKPVLVLSGHDHDQCTLIRELKFGSLIEHTVGTLSWQQGNLYPSFMLLSARKYTSANAANQKEAVMTQLCFLPWQTHIYIWYLSLFALTILILLFWPTGGVNIEHYLNNFMESIRDYCSLFRGRKEKIDDEDCEYEMMWDAEGSMHLVKKPKQTTTSHQTDKASSGRGNAVMRPVSKKSTSKEMEVAMNIESSADTGLLHRSGKSKTKIIIQKIMRTFRVVAVVAAVNLPLYMMLLFKDWIDK